MVENLQALSRDSAPIVELLTSEEVQEQVQRSEGDGNMLREYLEKNHGFEPKHLDTLYKYSQILFDIGKYQEAEIILYQYFILSSDPQKTFAVSLGCNVPSFRTACAFRVFPRPPCDLRGLLSSVLL